MSNHATIDFDEGTGKIYRYKWTWRVFFLVGGPLLMGLAFVALTQTKFASLEWFIFIGILLLGMNSLMEALITRVATSPAGVVLVQPFMRTSARWEDIERVDVNPHGYLNLVLRHSGASGCPPWRWWGQVFGYDRLIGLSPFVQHWENEPLIDDIRRHVPDLFK